MGSYFVLTTPCIFHNLFFGNSIIGYCIFIFWVHAGWLLFDTVQVVHLDNALLVLFDKTENYSMLINDNYTRRLYNQKKRPKLLGHRKNLLFLFDILLSHYPNCLNVKSIQKEWNTNFILDCDLPKQFWRRSLSLIKMLNKWSLNIFVKLFG